MAPTIPLANVWFVQIAALTSPSSNIGVNPANALGGGGCAWGCAAGGRRGCPVEWVRRLQTRADRPAHVVHMLCKHAAWPAELAVPASQSTNRVGAGKGSRARTSPVQLPGVEPRSVSRRVAGSSTAESLGELFVPLAGGMLIDHRRSGSRVSQSGLKFGKRGALLRRQDSAGVAQVVEA